MTSSEIMGYEVSYEMKASDVVKALDMTVKLDVIVMRQSIIQIESFSLVLVSIKRRIKKAWNNTVNDGWL